MPSLTPDTQDSSSKLLGPEPSPRQVAHQAGLRYVSDRQPGLRRQRWGRGFTYFDSTGNRITHPKERARLKALKIPPAWEEVWICPSPKGHLQATGRDSRGRKQYRYHPEWQQIRNLNKFERMIDFGRALPRLRQQLHQHLSDQKPGLALSRRRVLATVVRLLEQTLIRVGNETYARRNQSFGLTTLRQRHVDLEESTIRFSFCGKSGVEHEIELENARLAKILRRCQELPGQELFQYLDAAGERHSIDSGDVNEYLREVMGDCFSAKDFRTWFGTVYAAEALVAIAQAGQATQATQALSSKETEGSAETPRSMPNHSAPNHSAPNHLAPNHSVSDHSMLEQQIREAVVQTAAHLGNRPATCRKYYIHPTVFELYRQGRLLEQFSASHQPSPQKTEPHEQPSQASESVEHSELLSHSERAILRLLRNLS